MRSENGNPFVLFWTPFLFGISSHVCHSFPSYAIIKENGRSEAAFKLLVFAGANVTRRNCMETIVFKFVNTMLWLASGKPFLSEKWKISHFEFPHLSYMFKIIA